MLDLAWRPRAQLDRESIAIYLGLERGMPQAALDAIKGIDAALETVRTFPDVGGHFTDDHLEHEYRTTLAGPTSSTTATTPPRLRCTASCISVNPSTPIA